MLFVIASNYKSLFCDGDIQVLHARMFTLTADDVSCVITAITRDKSSRRGIFSTSHLVA